MFENEFEDKEIENNNIDENTTDDGMMGIPPQEPSAEAIEAQNVEKVEEVTDEQVEEPTAEEILEDASIPFDDVEIPDDNGIQVQNSVSEDGTVTVQPVKFASFDQLDQIVGDENKNLDILMDVKLQLNVELGRCELPIKKVLELTRGSIIELDKVAGEPIDVLVNGKFVARGEVVVIEESFGIRVTEIIN